MSKKIIASFYVIVIKVGFYLSSTFSRIEKVEP